MKNSRSGKFRVVCTYVCVVALLMTCAGVASPQTVSAALGLDVNATATVGLDAPTRELIANMPVTLREQTIQLLKDALPLVDTSVSGYLQRVNQIVDDQINHASCAALGSAKGIGDIFGAKITMSSPAPVSDLDKLWKKKADSYGTGSSPHDIVIGYSDFLANAAITSCEVASSSEAKDAVAAEQTNARWRWDVWKRVMGNCSDPEACTQFVFDQVSATLKGADKADLEAVRAGPRLYVIAKERSVPVGFYTRAIRWIGFESLPISAYERQMEELFRIQDDVLMARYRRGQAMLQSAQSSVDALNVLYEKEKGALVVASGGCNHPDTDQSIKQLMDQALTESEKIKARFAAAATAEPRLSELSNAELLAYDALLTECRALGTDADQQLKAMSGRTPGTDACKPHMGHNWPF